MRALILSLVVAAGACRSDSSPAPEPAPTPPAPATQPAPPPQPVPTPPTPPGPIGGQLEYEQRISEIFERAAPATVFVTENRIVRDRYSGRPLEVPAGTGTGYLWDDQGHVVTNFHVVANGRSFTVNLMGGEVLPAKLVGGDPTKDIAVLKVALPAPLAALEVAPAGTGLRVGQVVLAIGNPFGFDHTLTVGVISALGREVKGFGGVTIRDMIQTDASINPGNSGGPLLNSSGQLIGMNTMIHSKSGESSGIGFAVPVATLRRVVPQIIKYGRPRRAGLGIEIVPDNIARQNRINGIAVAKVDPRTPAARQGLRGLTQTAREVLLGDVIVAIDGAPVRTYDDLYTVLDEHAAGDEVTLRVLRGTDTVEMRVALVEIQ